MRVEVLATRSTSLPSSASIHRSPAPSVILSLVRLGPSVLVYGPREPIVTTASGTCSGSSSSNTSSTSSAHAVAAEIARILLVAGAVISPLTSPPATHHGSSSEIASITSAWARLFLEPSLAVSCLLPLLEGGSTSSTSSDLALAHPLVIRFLLGLLISRESLTSMSLASKALLRVHALIHGWCRQLCPSLNLGSDNILVILIILLLSSCGLDLLLLIDLSLRGTNFSMIHSAKTV